MARTPSTRPTIRTVAAASGVSPTTVSYVLAGKNTSIPAATAARVMAAAKDLGYRPNRAAQTMRTGRTGIALLSLHMLSDPWSLSVSQAVGAAAAERGLSPLILADGDWYGAISRLQPDVAYVDSPEDTPATRQRLDTLVQQGTSLVVFSATLSSAGYDVIRSEAGPGAEQVMAELAGHTRRIAYLTPESSETKGTRRAAYTRALREGLVDRDRTLLYDGSRGDAFRAAIQALRAPDAPEAIAANTDYAGLAAIAAAQFLGRRVPDDLLVTGLGNTEEGAHSTPSLTSSGPTDFYARQAQVILDAVDRPSHEATVHPFAWRLHHRASTARY